MNKIITLAALVATLTLAGCSITNPVAFSNDVTNATKMGESCQTGILFFPPLLGNFTAIEEARTNGAIKNIASIDQQRSMYVLWNTNCTVVRGN